MECCGGDSKIKSVHPETQIEKKAQQNTSSSSQLIQLNKTVKKFKRTRSLLSKKLTSILQKCNRTNLFLQILNLSLLDVSFVF